MKLSTKITVKRTPEDVFAFLANRTNLPQWATSVASARKVSKEGAGPGAKFRIEGRLAGRMLPSAYEITDYEPPRRLAGRGTGLLSFTETYELTPATGGTQVRQSARVELPGNAFLAGPLLRWLLSSQLKKDFQNLKRVLESEAMPAKAARVAAE